VSAPAPPPAAPATPELAAARQARRELEELRAAPPRNPMPAPPAIRDPVAACVWATVALIACLVTPAVALAGFAAYGLWVYAAAWRAGLRRTDCALRDPRLVMLYLGILAACGAVAAVVRLLR
jgi:hypothetical protein